MKKLYNNSLFIFRRDLRLIDNTALNHALSQSINVIPCFIFDPRQITEKNEYKSNNAIQFMIESLQELDTLLKKKTGKLYIFYGKAEDIVKNIIAQQLIDAVFINRDYTPFSIERDKRIQTICLKHTVSFNSYNDLLLNEPEIVLKKDGTHYSIFSAFYKKAIEYNIPEPILLAKGNWFTRHIKDCQPTTIFKKILPQHNKRSAITGGNTAGIILLKELKNLKNYAHDRDYPAKSTSFLSAHLKFGTLSIRQVYHAIKEYLGLNHPLVRQLYWRDFFTHIAYHAPKIFGNAYKEKYNHLPWNSDKALFRAWCEGKTGFPLVDAGMRELNATGFMHNRVRMIVASFLVKDLHINWLWGEQYFAQQLIDYDPAVNNGNWQWCASTGCDAQPYFRIFNPWLQQKKYDPHCVYIKKWVPELTSYDPKIIHQWFKHNSPLIKNYPRPIVDHTQESTIAKKMYQKLL